jgi:hypothetical protein
MVGLTQRPNALGVLSPPPGVNKTQKIHKFPNNFISPRIKAAVVIKKNNDMRKRSYFVGWVTITITHSTSAEFARPPDAICSKPSTCALSDAKAGANDCWASLLGDLHENGRESCFCVGVCGINLNRLFQDNLSSLVLHSWFVCVRMRGKCVAISPAFISIFFPPARVGPKGVLSVSRRGPWQRFML